MRRCLFACAHNSYFAISFLAATEKNDRCNYLSVQMHELGHNLNLGHSGDANTPDSPESIYGDQSGMMGYSYSRDDTPLMCFNAAKSWQLGWYADKAVTVTPFASGFSGRLMGIADYQHPAGYNVLVKIETGQDTDYYLNFNRKKGINSGTLEGGDKVMITRQGENGTGYSPSKLMAAISSGQYYTINDFAGSGDSVRVSGQEINLSSSPGYADVTISARCNADAQCQQGSSSVYSQKSWFVTTQPTTAM